MAFRTGPEGQCLGFTMAGLASGEIARPTKSKPESRRSPGCDACKALVSWRQSLKILEKKLKFPGTTTPQGASKKTMRGTDDETLVRASQDGDTEAFGQLVKRYQDRLYPTLLRLTGSPDDALDLLQDAFILAFQKLSRFRGQSSFFTWVYRIAVNLALSERRNRKGRPQVKPVQDMDQLDHHAASRQDDPSLPLEQAEDESRVQRALLKLPEEARVVVVLRDLDGLSYEEISDALNIPLGTVRSRLHRARVDLRSALERDERASGEVRTAPGASGLITH